MAKKALAVVKDSKEVAVVKGAYTIALSPVALLKLKEMQELVEYAAEQTALAVDVTIEDEESDAVGKNLLVNLRKARKAGEELQSFFTSPLEASKKTVIATFKAIGAEAKEQEQRLAKESGDLYMKTLNEAREAAAEAQRKVDEAAAKARKLGQAPKRELPAEPTQPLPEKTVVTENGSVGMGSEFRPLFERGVNLDLVPRQYLKLDEAAVRAAVKSGVRVIPGIVVEECAKLAVR